MTPEQKAAWLMSQSVCALGDIMGMHSQNMQRQHKQEAMAYEDDAFFEVCERYGIHHEKIVDFLTE